MARFLFMMVAAAATLAAGCNRPATSRVVAPPRQSGWLADVTDQKGLAFVHVAGKTDSFFMPQIMGSGCALFDFDNDGRLDVYLLNNAGPASGSTNRLFRQTKNGTFVDVSAGSGLDFAAYSMGVACGDVNNDGLVDVVVTEYRGTRLFLNGPAGKFRDVSAAAGIDNPLWGASTALFDYDRDGWLDLVVVNYVDYDPTKRCDDLAGRPDYCGPQSFVGTITRLYRNRGGRSSAPAAFRFDDMSTRSGVGRLPGPGLGVLCADFNNDRWPDVFVANDGEPNRLWLNQHDGTFREEAVANGVAYNAAGQAQAGMGIAWGDVDGDGHGDVFVTHLTTELNTLWRREAAGFYQDRTAAWGLAVTDWRGTGFGTVLADFDHDGDLDLAIANGRVRQDRLSIAEANHPLGQFWERYADRNQLLANDASKRYLDVSADNPALCGTRQVARGLAAGDIDNDGAVDLLLTTVGGPARLLRNVASPRGHWLLVRAVDPRLRRDAYGAEVTVRAGQRRWKRWINPAGSYLCSSDPRAHFGLGAAVRVDAVEVLWPDGTLEEFPGGRVDRFLELRRGTGRASEQPEE
jgi:hypothetical protein